MQKIAFFPGSFDPFTKGHESVLQKALPLFDQIIIGIGHNTNKSSFYNLESRMAQIQSIYASYPSVSIVTYQGLTVNKCLELGANYILRGLRDTKDFEYEKAICQMNLQLAPIETIFYMTDPSVAAISATIIREIAKNNGNIDQFVTNADLLVK